MFGKQNNNQNTALFLIAMVVVVAGLVTVAALNSGSSQYAGMVPKSTVVKPNTPSVPAKPQVNYTPGGNIPQVNVTYTPGTLITKAQQLDLWQPTQVITNITNSFCNTRCDLKYNSDTEAEMNAYCFANCTSIGQVFPIFREVLRIANEARPQIVADMLTQITTLLTDENTPLYNAIKDAAPGQTLAAMMQVLIGAIGQSLQNLAGDIAALQANFQQSTYYKNVTGEGNYYASAMKKALESYDVVTPGYLGKLVVAVQTRANTPVQDFVTEGQIRNALIGILSEAWANHRATDEIITNISAYIADMQSGIGKALTAAENTVSKAVCCGGKCSAVNCSASQVSN